MEFENVSRETIEYSDVYSVPCLGCGCWFDEDKLEVIRLVLRDSYFLCIRCDPLANEKIDLPLSSITKLNNNSQNGGEIE